MLYDVTFAHRFWHGRQMIVCDQTRLCAVVDWLLYQSLSSLGSLTFSMHQKSAYITASSDAGFRQNSMLYGSSSQWNDGFNLLRIFFICSWHLSIGTDVYTWSKPTYMQHMLACLCICWFRVRLLRVLDIAMDCSRYDEWSHPIRVHLTFSQTQLVEVVTWQVQYIKRQMFRFSLQFTQCKQEAANSLPALKRCHCLSIRLSL